MERYIGIDVHSESCTVAIMSQAGKRLNELRVETNGRALLDCIRAIAGSKHVCLEEGTQSEWLYEILSPHVSRVVVIQPAGTPGNKSDSIDAWKCAEQLRQGTYRGVFKSKNEFSALRAAVRTHLALTRDVVRAKNRIRSLLRSRGILARKVELYSPERRSPVLQVLSAYPHLLEQAQLLLAQLDSLVGAQHQAEAWLEQEAAKQPIVVRLATVPGIGLIRASQIAATIVTPHRFRTKRQFWSYCGLGIVTRSSADWTQDKNGRWIRSRVPLVRGLNKNRQPLLKSVFKGAALFVTTRLRGPLRDAYDRLLGAGTKPNLARLTIARRMASAVLAMWKYEQDFDPTRV